MSTSSKKTSSNDTSKKVAVQTADPKTGISWDGKSKIVYTYADGSTGTKPKNGATYEVIPGVLGSYLDLDVEEPDNKCNWCGKTKGDGTDGTCVIYLMKDTCKNCGTTGVLNHCHTCK